MDDSLRDRIRAGQQDAFAVLFDELAGPVYRHAMRVLADRTAAEDVVSATFLEAWRGRGRLQPDRGDLTGWVFGIATNVLRNTTRASRRRRAFLARQPPPERVPDFADDVVDRLAEAQRLRAARAAFDRLRPHEQEVVALCVWAGLDYAQTATALGIPVGTVRSRLSRARRRLRALATGAPDSGSVAGEPPPGLGQVPGGRRTAADASREGRR